MRRLLRVTRFVRCCSGPVVGEVVSDCFRFRELLAKDGVIFGPDGVDPEPDACPDVDAEPGGCGIVLCCFCGELLAEEGKFCGVPTDGPGCESDEVLVGGGTLEYKVTAGVTFTPLRVGKFWKAVLPLMAVFPPCPGLWASRTLAA